MPAWVRATPQVRGATKNQRWSFLIGPPTLIASSKSLMVLFAVSRPRSFRSCDRFVASIDEFAYIPERIVRNEFPPSFGTMLTTMPSALVSAEMPLVDMTISSTEAAFSW